ncbi:hypothetical protein Z951_04655 [Streptomyces sp. PRh5]|nr:hypothetical protein Z951_04655 [Streptomyces sp. PRh5]
MQGVVPPFVMRAPAQSYIYDGYLIREKVSLISGWAPTSQPSKPVLQRLAGRVLFRVALIHKTETLVEVTVLMRLLQHVAPTLRGAQRLGEEVSARLAEH